MGNQESSFTTCWVTTSQLQLGEVRVRHLPVTYRRRHSVKRLSQGQISILENACLLGKININDNEIKYFLEIKICVIDINSVLLILRVCAKLFMRKISLLLFYVHPPF